MTKFSDFIRAPGTAGPPTREGIRALGFALQSDFPVKLEKYLWVGGAQAFTGGEKTQGQANLGVIIGTDVQAFSTSLNSLAGLTTTADQLAYTTAANVWAVTTLTAFGRSLIDDANAAAARATLGLGTIATQAANNVAITGGSIAGITDLAIADGGTGASTATAARSNLGLVIGTDVQAQNARLATIAGLTGDNGSFIRWTGAATAVMQSILGTVTQSAGVPTGALFETGSTPNGRYVRFADGTQICWLNTSVTDQAINTAYSSLYSGQRSWTFPAPFSGAPAVPAPSIKWGTSRPWGSVDSVGNTSAIFNFFDVSSRATGTDTLLNFSAIGRWF